MIKRIVFLAVAGAACALGEGRAEAGWPFRKSHGDEAGVAMAQNTPWHGGYYSAEWGRPVAVVVPPTAGRQTRMNWGVGGSRVTNTYHQFNQNYSGATYEGSAMRPAPPQPSSTDQMGYYYVRGPWH